MPIEKTEFQRYKHGRIHAFLLSNNSNAYTVKEISRALQIPALFVSMKLSNLCKMGLVKKHESYYAVSDDNDKDDFIIPAK